MLRGPMALFDRFSRLRTRGGKRDDRDRTKGDGGSGGGSCHDGGAGGQAPTTSRSPRRTSGKRQSCCRSPTTRRCRARSCAEAKARVARVYEVIGVRTVWVDSEETVRQRQDGRLHLTVMLLSREMAEKKISAEGLSDHVLGQAHLPSGRAHIFCDRIATMPGAPTSLAIALGDVIAHEVGHLVLRTNSHSRSRHHARERGRARHSAPEL